MSPIETYFDKIFVINLERRADRWDHVLQQMRLLGIENFERFNAYDRPLDHNRNPSGNQGCTASHRALYEIISYHGWNRVLIFEDDFSVCVDNPQQQFQKMVGQVPDNWDMLYLGGHYADEPKNFTRISRHVIKCGRMFTTSSYAITSGFARKIAPYISGVGPIDSLLGGFCTPENNVFIVSPRIFVQYPSFSDLTDSHSSNHQCMMDRNHEIRILPLEASFK